MLKKTAAAYDLAHKFLQKGDAKNARLAMEIGDRFQKIAGESFTKREDRYNPTLVSERALNLTNEYLDKLRTRMTRVDPNAFSYAGTSAQRRKKAIEQLAAEEGIQKALADLLQAQAGRKPEAASVLFEELVQLYKEDKDKLGEEDNQIMLDYLRYLQPKTGREEDKMLQYDESKVGRPLSFESPKDWKHE